MCVCVLVAVHLVQLIVGPATTLDRKRTAGMICTPNVALLSVNDSYNNNNDRLVSYLAVSHIPQE
jgi:hypothetical protein